MKTVELDLTGCTCLFDIHERIRVAFEFPEWYGANWDAFWDLLWSECEADEVVIKGEDSLPDELKKHIDMLHRILEKEVAFRNDNLLNPFSYQITR